MTPTSAICSLIQQRLQKIECDENVRIIYACEAGSRAWGFASPDSDYDVRFIYVRPMEWYLSYNIENERDVIDNIPALDDIDINGWDLRKALNRFARTNGALLEWLNSPIKYLETENTALKLRSIAKDTFNPVALCYHYRHLAEGNAKDYLFGNQVKLKKYFYVLRALLAIRYIDRHSAIPPVEFIQLVHSVAPDSIRSSILGLLKQKQSIAELGVGASLPEINGFITDEFERHGDAFKGQGRPDIINSEKTVKYLNEIFRSTIHNLYSERIDG